MKEFSDADPAASAGPKQFDSESVRTEDFVNKFSQLMMPESAPSEKAGSVGVAKVGRGCDLESVRTEDFAREFRRTLVPPVPTSTAGSGSGGFSRPGAAAAAASIRPFPAYRAAPPPPASSPWRGAHGGSAEAESAPIGGGRTLQRPQVVAFDDSYLGGGGGGSVAGSSIRAQALRERIGSLLRVPPSGVNLDAADRRLQELLQSRQQPSRQQHLPGGGSSRNSSPPRVSSLVAIRQLSPTRLAALNRGAAAAAAGAQQQGRISTIREAPSRSLQAEDPADDDDLMLADDEFANEVRYQSRLIQRELELERRHRAPPRDRSASPTRTPRRESLDRKVLELDELNQQVRKTLQEKEKIVGELHFVQDCLRRHQAEVRLSEKMSRDNKSRADDTKTELMLAEMKRDSTAKELEQLNEELNQKKDQLRRMEETCRARMKELQDFESIGVAKEEIENILTERDELYQLVRQNEDAEYQRYELEKRLTQTREEMQSQATMAQQKVIALEEELEASLTKIADTSEERNSLKLRLVDLEDKMKLLGGGLEELTDANRQLARAKEVAERERVEEVERLKMRMQGDLLHIQRRTEEEEASYKRQIQQLKDNLDGLQREVDGREEANCDYREQLMRLENQLALTTEAKNHLAQEMERQLERAAAESDRRLEAAREDARRDTEDRQERERAAWQAESAKELRAVQDRLQRSVGQLEQELQCRVEELKGAQELARSKEAALKAAEEEHRTELREHVRATLRTEKDKWDRESSERWHRELAAVKSEAGRAIESLQVENKKKGDAIREFESELHKVTSELEREREKSKALQRDRVAAINHLKEVAKEEAANEVRIVREQLEAAATDEMAKLREQLRFTEETLVALRSEFENSVRRETEFAASLERTERALVNQANSECLKIAQVLGVTPRRVTPGQSTDQQLGGGGGQLSHRSLSAQGHPVTAALANLEACSEELRAYCAELRDESQKLRGRIAQDAKDREDDAARLRVEFAQEKSAELQALRERLIQDHMQEISKLAKVQSDSLDTAVKEKEAEVRELRAGMQKWKSETAERLAARLQDEFRREFDKKIRELRNTVRTRDQELQNYKKEVETMEQERLGVFKPAPAVAAAGGGGPVGDLETSAKAVLQLQERVKALRDENMSLRKQTVSNRASPTIRGLGLVETPRLGQQQQQLQQTLMSSSLSNLSQKDSAAAGADNYVHHLESNLRALEDRVRRAERQNELIGKDRINLANKQQRLQQQLMQQTQGDRQASARTSSRGGSFRAPSSTGPVSGR